MEEMNKKAPEAAEKQHTPAKKDKKPFGERVGHFFRSYVSEIKKIVWPTWKQVLKGSAVVVVIVSICAIAIGLLDFAFSQGIAAIVNLF